VWIVGIGSTLNSCKEESHPGSSAEQPTILKAVSKELSDFGTIENPITLRNTFSYTNAGSQAVSLNIKTSCGCSVVSLSPRTLHPGEMGIVEVTVPTLNRSGSFLEYVEVAPSEGRSITFWLSGNVSSLPILSLHPLRVDVGTIRVFKTVDKSFIAYPDIRGAEGQIVRQSGVYDRSPVSIPQVSDCDRAFRRAERIDN
jgi:hypothetical protein